MVLERGVTIIRGEGRLLVRRQENKQISPLHPYFYSSRRLITTKVISFLWKLSDSDRKGMEYVKVKNLISRHFIIKRISLILFLILKSPNTDTGL